MRSLFTAALNQPLNTLVDSASITLSGVGTNVPFTLVSGAGTSAYKNGASITSTVVSDGDRVRIRVRSSTAYATPAFGVIKIGSEETIFSVVTVIDPAPIPSNAMDGVLPLDLTKYPDGSTYTPSSVGNAVTVYSNGAEVEKISLIAPATNTSKTTDAIVIANYHGNQIFYLNDQLDVIASINTGDNTKPYGTTTTQTSLFDDFALTWVTLSGTDQIAVYNRSHQLVRTYGTGDRPMGIARSADGKHVYVANFGSNTVTHFTYSGGNWGSTTVNVGLKPFEIAVDAQGSAWVTCVGEDKVFRITTANAVISFTLASSGLRGIVIDNDGFIWVAASKSNAIVKLSSAGALVQTVTTGLHPYALSLAPDGAIDVVCFVQSKVESYSTAGALVRSFTTSKFPYGVATVGENTLVANLYANTPEYGVAKDQAANAFGLNDPASIPKNTLAVSNAITVSGLGPEVAVAAAVPADLYSAKLIKNGSLIGSNTTVVNGDTLAIQFTAPNTFGTLIEIPLFIGNVYEFYTTRTEPEDATPNAFTFENVINANLNEVFTSNTITISGLTSGSIVPFTIDVGTIILNGVNSGAKTVNVRNGDTVALRATSSGGEKETVLITALAGKTIANGVAIAQTKSVWQITTKATPEYWIKPEFKSAGEFEPEVEGDADATGKYITRIGFDHSSNSIPVSNEVVAHVTARLLIPSYFDGGVYQFDDTNAFNLIAPLDQSRKPVSIAGNRFIAYTGSANFVLDADTGTEIELPAIPRKIVYDAGRNNVFVTLSNGTIARIQNGEISAVIEVGGQPHALDLDSSGNIWISDTETNVVKHIVDGVVAKSYASGVNVWDLVVTSSQIWTANSYDNTVSKIQITNGTTFTYKVGSVPNQIEVDTSGNIWVGHYASRDVYKLTSSTGAKAFEKDLQYAAPTYMSKHGTSLYITELNPNLIAQQDKVQLAKPISDLIVFEPAVDELPNTRVKSNVVVLEGLIRPVQVSIVPNNDYDLYVNGVKIVGTTAILNNGDEIYLDALSAVDYFTERVVTLSDSQSISEFRIQTETDVMPNFMMFDPLFDAYPKRPGQSNVATVTGMTPGHTTRVKVSRVGWMVSINGEAPVELGAIKNGDTIKLLGPIRGPYSTTSDYNLLAAKREALIGTFTIHTHLLDGPTLLFRQWRYSVGTEWEHTTHRNVTWSEYDMPSAEIGQRQFLNSESPTFELMPPANRFISEENQFVLRETSTQPTAAIVVFEKAVSSPAFEFRTPLQVKIVRRIISAPTRQSQLIPWVYNWSNAQQEFGEDDRFIRNSNQNQKTSPVMEFVRNSNVNAIEVPRVPFMIRHSNEYPSASNSFEKFSTGNPKTVEHTYERNISHSVYSMGRQIVLGPSRNQLSASTEFELRSRSNVFISPDSQYESKEHRRFVFMAEKEYVRNHTVVHRTIERNSFEIAVRPATKLFSLYSPEIVQRSVVEIDRPIFVLHSKTHSYVGMGIDRNTYVIHDYTFAETPEEEGAYSTPEAAIAAGVESGYPDAYAVLIDKGTWMWATNLGGDIVGTPVDGGGSIYPLPSKWYVQGG